MSLDSAVQALVKRLETVTSRLEQVEKQLASGASGASGGSSGGGSTESVSDYDQLIADFIKPLIKSTNELGNDELKAQVALVEKAVQAQRQFLQVAASSSKPSDATLNSLIDPTSQLINQIVTLREKARANKQFNHLSAISEGISALGWVVVEPTPAPFVNDARASSEFYSNKILVEFKKTNQAQVDWVGHWNGFLKELAAFIKKNHTTGLVWNPHGGSASAAAPAAPSGGPPPPPKPPAAPLTAPGQGGGAAKAGGPNPADLFAEINKGGAITSGLKPVDKSQMTHKNPQLRGTSVVPAEASSKAERVSKTPAGQKKGTSKIELSGNKWLVEWQEDNKSIEIKETEAKQTVYIYKCTKSVVKISGKINAITIDGCQRLAVVFEDAVSGVELVNSNSVEVQITGKVPNVAIDKCSAIQLYLSKGGLDVEIVTSKSDSMNVLIPDPSGAPDPIEIAIPEQYKTVIKNNKLITSTVEHV